MSKDQDRGEQRPIDNDGGVRFHPPITSTTHILPFERLSPLDFERLCLWLVEREGYARAEHLGLAGSEQGRDVIAYKPTSQGEELWYFQCKRYRSIRTKTLKDEIDKYLKLAQEKPHLKPFGVVFVVSCAVSADAREEVGNYCEQYNLASEFWALTELDLRVKRHPDLLREFFDLYTRPIGVPFQAPPLPAHFVPRPEVSDALKAHLLTYEVPTPGVLVVSAIHGLGGIGKSTLATALTYDPEVQARFPDGILWAVLGQQPEILSLLMGWIQALGDYEYRPSTIEAASIQLRALLRDKACLLVVDDAWQANHVQSFMVGGGRCRILITTREALIALAVGADLYDLDVMTPEQALTLLERRLVCDLTGMGRETALELAVAVGYLPLALELAAAQIADGVPWAELLADLQAEIARLEALDLPGVEEVTDESIRKRLSLLASFHLSLRRLSKEKRDAFAWLGVLPEDVTLTPAMTATAWETDARSARDMLRYFRYKALLMAGASLLDGTLTYRLHDLLHDLARRMLAEPPELARAKDLPGLGLTLQKAHALFLQRYRAKIQEGLWHTLPDDGYIHAHLTWHMEEAGWNEALHALLCEETAEGQNGWYEARERLGQTAGYVADVVRAWHLADTEFHSQRVSTSVGLCGRYALITTSVNSLARNIPPPLLVALVRNRIWPPAQGLAYARQAPDARQRAEALLEMSIHLLEPLKEQTLLEALATARRIRASSVRAQTLSKLVLYLPDPLRGQVLHHALEALREIEGDTWRAKLLLELTPQLVVPGHFEEVLAAIQEIRHDENRAQGLMKLALHLPESLRELVLREALTEAQKIHAVRDRIRTLSELIPHLPESLREQALREALTAVHGIRQVLDRIRALSELIPHLRGRLRELVLREALTEAQKIHAVRDRIRALSELIPHLPESLREQALQEALTAAQSYSRQEPLGSHL